MAVTERQAIAVATSGGGASSVAMTPGTALAASGLLVAFGFTRSTFSGISDTGGRTWTQQASFTNSNGNTAFKVWTAPTGVGGDTPTVTATTSASNWVQGCLVEVAGCDTSTTPISVSATQTQGTAGTTLSIGPTGTSGANELAISFVGDDGGSTWTAPSGWATAVQQGSLTVAVSWKSVSSQTVTAAWTISANEPCGGIVLAIKAASASGAIAGTSALAIGETGSLTGAGALSATSALVFAQTGTLTGAGVLAGSSALAFGQTGTLLQPGLVGSAALTFAQTGTLLASGVLVGSSALQFGQTGALTGAGVLAGSSALSLGQTANLTAVGILTGASALAFGQTATLAAFGVLAGTSALTFGASATADLPPGALVGSSSLAFASSGTLSGFGALIGNCQIVLSASIANTADPNQPGPLDSPLMSDGHYRRKKRKKARRAIEQIREALEPQQPVFIPPASLEREIKPAEVPERASLALVANEWIHREMDDEEALQWILRALDEDL